ncbi:hypothetical protein B597_004820 [Stutzerimonas stutzeri KOS6]|uniref:Chemotaxis protein CheR n=1 Tax=Stutzerimonas stutzeri KOS6 TaxID=1218352 RepID=A0A061JVA9_STUST|nr:hypothetical protein B597_004820 [Stutzerimonas stutzeri KOS6]
MEAVSHLLHALNVELPFAYVVLQHVSPTHKSLLPEILARETRLTVCAMDDGVIPEAGVVYVVPPNSNAVVRDGRFLLFAARPDVFPKPSINDFFISLAAEHGEQATGIVLSGTGSDGTAGLRAIMAAGGATLVQCPETAKYDGMPRSAISAGAADFILPPEGIATKLEKLARLQVQVPQQDGDTELPAELLELLKSRRDIDFSGYKPGTISRRLRRRMVATSHTSVEDYLLLTKQHPEELDNLSKDILISVTAFFRDNTAFDTLRSYVEDVCRNAIERGNEIRAWVAGCATGEEAYSIAMLFDEALAHLGVSASIQIFATDVDDEALAVARRGLYPSAALEILSEQRLQRYFVPVGSNYEVGKRLRDMIVFARHNLVSDPPFLRIDLVTCRNVLIYFDSSLQQQVLKRFHFALVHGGLLFLGRSESIGTSDSLFAPLDRRERIFRKQKGGHSLQVAAIDPSLSVIKARRRQDVEIQHLLETVVLHLGITVALCDVNANVLRTAGEVDKFFHVPRGRANSHVSELITSVFRGELISLLHQLNKNPQSHFGRPRIFDGEAWRLSVRPVPGLHEQQLLVILESVQTGKAAPEPLQASPLVSGSTEEELVATREHLQALIEELATANEEMQSLNEEAQASNEELQATNEEMEAANEELQATNEELMSLNEELNVRTGELQALNDEYTHVYDALDFAVLVFDREQHLVRFNAAAARLFGFKHAAIHQHVSRIRLPSHFRVIEDCLDQAKNRREPQELLIEHHGRQFHLQITPGVSLEQHVELLVCSLVDVTDIRKTESDLRSSRAQLETLMANTIVLLSMKDLSGNYTFANPAFLESFGLVDGKVEGRNDFELFPESFATASWSCDLEALREKRVVVSEHVLPGAQERVFRFVHQVLRDEHGRPNLIINEAEDITAHKISERQLRISAKVFEQAGEAIVVTDRHMVIRSINSAFTRITGYSAEEAIGCQIDALLDSGENPQELYQSMWSGLENRSFWQGELTNRRKDGALFSEWLTINRIHESANDYYVAVFSDITRIKESQAKAEYLATHDALTGLPNRSLFQDRLDLAIAQARRSNGIAALMFMDLDNFKGINDTLGHDIGDQLLVEVSRRLSSLMREVDTVARLGGDEFTVVLTDIDFAGTERVAERIIQALRQPIEVGSRNLYVTGSIGLAFYPDDGETSTTLIKAADTAMYRAKHNGRNGFELFKPELHAQLQRQSNLEAALREALRECHLRLVFQPKFTTEAPRRMIGAEALLRWTHPEMGVVSPADFIPAAETGGLIKEVDRKVIQLAVQALAYWQGNELDPVPVAVNISARSIQDDHFPDMLAKRLHQYRVPATLVQVEITEGTLLERTSTALGNIQRLKEMGVRLSIDDFGTGYSSLSYLKRLPLAELKIDKTFVDGLGGKDKSDEAIAKAILAMAAALNLLTVAEGVETEGQLQWLSDNGCDYIQGYLCSRPLEYLDFTEKLKNGNRTWP